MKYSNLLITKFVCVGVVEPGFFRMCPSVARLFCFVLI